jgi:hypothetical protein
MKLRGRKHRKEINDRLNHSLDYRNVLATAIPPGQRTRKRILEMLKAERVADSCHVMADGNENDGKEPAIEHAVDELFGTAFEIVLICPPIPMALYKEEAIGDMLLLKPVRTSQVARDQPVRPT